MTTTAWVFPGQGSQKVGMMADLASQPAAQEKLAAAEEILGWSVLAACEDEAKLSDTRYTQPCLYTVEALLVDAMRERGTAEFVAGHSLGEYVALYAAQVFDFASGLRLVKQRAELMANTEGGKMIAMIGFDRDALDSAIAANPDVVLANDNSAGQVVISGTPAGVDAIAASVKSKRAVPLAVSGAFHSPLMNPAAAEFQTALDAVTFQAAQIPVFSNVDPTPATAADTLKARLSQQMTGSVRWREIMAAFAEKQVATVVEIGPGNVLTGLFKRDYRDINRVNVSAIAAIA